MESVLPASSAASMPGRRLLNETADGPPGAMGMPRHARGWVPAELLRRFDGRSRFTSTKLCLAQTTGTKTREGAGLRRSAVSGMFLFWSSLTFVSFLSFVVYFRFHLAEE